MVLRIYIPLLRMLQNHMVLKQSHSLDRSSSDTNAPLLVSIMNIIFTMYCYRFFIFSFVIGRLATRKYDFKVASRSNFKL